MRCTSGCLQLTCSGWFCPDVTKQGVLSMKDSGSCQAQYSQMSYWINFILVQSKTCILRGEWCFLVKISDPLFSSCNHRTWLCFFFFYQVRHDMTYKRSLISVKWHSRLRVDDTLSDANNAAEPFYENLKAEMFPTCWQVSVKEK